MRRKKKDKGKKRFEVIEKHGFEPSYEVFRDNETGVLYMSYNSGFGAGVTVLVDRSGTPLVDDDI